MVDDYTYKSRYHDNSWTATHTTPGYNPPVQRYYISTGQRTSSLNNGGPPKQGASGIGGNFETVKWSYGDSFNGTSVSLDAYPGQHYSGPIFAYSGMVGIGDYPDSGKSNEITLMSLGSTAIAKTVPTSPTASLANALIELKRDGLPHSVGSGFMRDRTSHLLKTTGDEYLNVEFGWKPLLSDVRSVAKAVRHSKEITDQFVSNSGKNIRRRCALPSLEEQTMETLTGRWPVGPPNVYFYKNGPFTLYKTTATTRRRWFSGCYTYYLSLGSSQAERIRLAVEKADKLYGVRITPQVLWEAAPWSWAVDWFTNVGDVLANVSSFSEDGLVLRWGYVMENTVTTTRYEMPGVILSDGSQVSLSQTFTTEWKVRRGATPYGFGFDMSALSGRQEAIIAALGMSRSGGRAR